MKTYLQFTEQDIVPEAPVMTLAIYTSDEAARAVVSDNAGKIALLRVGLYDYPNCLAVVLTRARTYQQH